MGFFKKEERETINSKSSEMPKLPDLPTMPKNNTLNLPEQKMSFELPSLNDFQSKKEPEYQFPIIPQIQSSAISMETIKDSINENPIQPPKQIQPIQKSPERKTFEVQEPQMSFISRNISSKEPLYIKIDKFQEAIDKFSDIKKKISEIENELRRIKEVKLKEEKELKDWEEGILLIRNKIDSIDRSLFNRI